MARISDEYLKLNADLHKSSEHFGSSAWRCWGHHVLAFIGDYPEQSCILDYGCGKGTISDNVSGVTNYDPAIPEYAEEPSAPYDLVLCVDVLEHVEEQHVDEVLDDLKAKMIVAGFFVISIRPACAKLPDGRNAHITVRPQEWWMRKLKFRWPDVRIVTEKENDHFAVIVQIPEESFDL